MGSNKANQTSFRKGEMAPNWNGFKKGMVPWNKGLRGVQAGEKSPRWKGGLPNCKVCETKLSQREPKYMLCKTCYHKDKNYLKELSRAHIGINSGDKASNWRGGITSSERMERIKFRNTMQKQVFERDDYKCVFCGTGGNLQVDHIQPWAKYVEGRFDINNCRTLCSSCHYKITFGREMPLEIKGWGHNFIERMVV